MNCIFIRNSNLSERTLAKNISEIAKVSFFKVITTGVFLCFRSSRYAWSLLFWEEYARCIVKICAVGWVAFLTWFYGTLRKDIVRYDIENKIWNELKKQWKHLDLQAYLTMLYFRNSFYFHLITKSTHVIDG